MSGTRVFRGLLLVSLSMAATQYSSTGTPAAELQIGDTVTTTDAAPLRAGQTTRMTVEKGTTLIVRKLLGGYALVTVEQDGEKTSGWISSDYLAVVGTKSKRPAGNDTPQASSLTRFRVSELNSLRKKMKQAAEMPMEIIEKLPKGWSKSPLDPTKLLAPMAKLKLKEGYVLRAYQYHDEGNGNGVVWAMPDDSRFPEPEELLDGIGGLPMQPPKPGKALDNFMEVIAGDGSPESYIQASLLSREMKEFGALWHGASWSWHSLLEQDPWTSQPQENEGDGPPMTTPTGPESDWTWKAKKPTDWAPRVTIEGKKASVVFYTYSPLYEQTIYKFVDEFRPGEYRFSTERTKIGTAPGGLAP